MKYLPEVAEIKPPQRRRDAEKTRRVEKLSHRRGAEARRKDG